MNALCFVVVIFALLQWKGPESGSGFPLENFLESFSTAVRYVRFSPAIQVVLARNILFAFFISVIPALIPVIGLKELHLQPCSLGLLFTSMGAGSVFSAVFVLPRVRERVSSNTLIVLGNALVVLVYLLMALVRQRELFLVVAAHKSLQPRESPRLSERLFGPAEGRGSNRPGQPCILQELNVATCTFGDRARHAGHGLILRISAGNVLGGGSQQLS